MLLITMIANFFILEQSSHMKSAPLEKKKKKIRAFGTWGDAAGAWW